MGRPFARHIDSKELEALACSPSDGEQPRHGLSRVALQEAERHVESCADCRGKALKYRQLVTRTSGVVVSEFAPPRTGCPAENVDWHAVAAGLWPQLKATQLIKHAALCDHCGPLLRAAASVDDDPTPAEEKLLAKLRVQSRPIVVGKSKPIPLPPWGLSNRQRFLNWQVLPLAMALMLLVAAVAIRPASRTPLSGPQFAEFAVNAHRQHAQGSLALNLQSDSEQTLNQWLKANAQFSLALPASPGVPGEDPPYHLEGARLIPVGAETATYIAYRMRSGPVGLMVANASVALASGGIQVDFKKVSFHYATVSGYKVVTWSVHGLTYALVSQEGNSTQRSCMVCHSAMRDRDLSQTPTPFSSERNPAGPMLQ